MRKQNCVSILFFKQPPWYGDIKGVVIIHKLIYGLMLL